MTRLATMTDEALHEAIYRLSCRQRAGDRSCDELLGKLLDEADSRALGEDGDEYDEADQEALLGYFLGIVS